MKFKLRKFKKGDEKSLQENINDKEIYMNTAEIPYPYKMKDAKHWINFSLKQYKKKKPEVISYVIDINGEVAGSVGLHEIDYKNKKAEVGYWLAKKYWGNGVMTQALKEVVRIGLNQKKLVRICACVFEHNKASASVLEKSGFAYEGLLKKAMLKDKKHLNALLYAKTK